MNFFDGKCYRINKILLTVVGQWPFDRPIVRRGILIAITAIAGTQFVAKICSLASSLNDTDLVFESLPPMIVDIGSAVKMINFSLMESKVNELLEKLRANCQSITHGPEIEVLSQYAESAKKFTFLYAGSIFFCAAAYILLPFAPCLMGGSANVTEKPLIHNVEYYVDLDEYYYPIMIHANVSVVLIIVCVVAMDSILNVFIQHACSLFGVLRYRLEHVVQSEGLDVELYPPLKDDECYERIIRSVEMHNNAIEFADLVEATYSRSFVIQGGLNMLALSVTGVQAMTNLNNIHELLRQLAMQSALLFRLFLENYQGQLLTDNSTQVQESLINTNWYQMSMRSRRLLFFMIMRAHSPSELTAGKLYPISMATYSTIIRRSMSYFALLRSMQRVF